jgi:hypothetical protein
MYLCKYAMRSLSSFALSLAFGIVIASAQEQPAATCSASFTLLEKGTRTPIADASVYLMPETTSQVTNDKGKTVFENLSCAEHHWIFNVTGYARLDYKATITKTSGATIYLEKLNQSSFETVVTDDKLKRDGSKRSLKGDQFQKAIGARGDPVVALENEPGVSGFAQQGGIVLQGADPEDSRFYVNGHEVPLIFHELGFSSIFIPDVIDSVELMPAGFGAEYGRTIGGNVNLVTKSPKKDRFHVMSYVDLLNAAAVVQGPINDNHSFWIGGRQSYLGFVFDVVTNEDSNVTFNQVPQFYDLEGNYEWKISDQWKFDLTGFTARDQLKIKIKDLEDPFFKGDIGSKTKFFRFIPRLQYQPSEQAAWTTSFGLGKDYLKFDLNDQFFDADIGQWSVRSEWKQEWTKNITTFLGTDSQLTNFRADVDLPAGTFPNAEGEVTPLSLRDTIRKKISEDYYDLGFYLRTNVTTDDQKWLLSPNVRLEYFSLTDSTRLEPRFEITRTMNKYLKLRATTGLYYQPPQPPELEKSFGNPNLNDPRAIHYSVGANLDTRDAGVGFWGDTTVFYKDLSGLVTDSNQIINTPDGPQPEKYNNSAEGYVAGSQWSVNYQFNKWYTGLVYTILWSRKSDPLRGEYPSINEQRHNLNLRTSVDIGKNWTLSSRARYITGLRYTPVIDAFYDLDEDIYFPVYGSRNSAKGPSFFQVDVRADRKWIFNKWIMSLYVDIQNVLNRANALGVQYNFDYTDTKKNTGIPILPTFGIKGEW